MDWQAKQDLALQALHAAKFTTTSGHARTNCPFCIDVVGKDDKKQALAIHTATGFFKCWRCSTSGKIRNIEELALVVPEEPVEAPKEPEMGPPPGFMALGDEPGVSAYCTEEARAYLAGRGLGDAALWRAAGIGCVLDGRFGGRVIVPVLAPDARWLGWVGRTWVKRHDRPYMNAPGMKLGTTGNMFNERVLSVATDTPAMVMEGVFDALPYWTDAVAVLGKPTYPQLDTLRRSARPVVFVLDGDAWEDAEMWTLHLRLDGQRAGFVKLPPRVDPDEVDHTWLRAQAARALEVEL